MTDASTRRTFFTPPKAEISAAGRTAESREWSNSRRKGAALEKCFRQAVSEIVETPRAQAAAARKRNEKFELAYLDDYEEWREEPEKVNKPAYMTENSENVLNKESEITSRVDKKSNGDISFYEAFDRFQAEHNVSENDEEIFYGSVFQEFNEQWQGKNQAVSEKKSEVAREEKVDYSKLSLEDRVKLLPPPTTDQMAELKEYQKRMGYDEGKMKSMKYKMTIYDEFLKEYEYRKKHCGVKDNVQKKWRDRER